MKKIIIFALSAMLMAQPVFGAAAFTDMPTDPTASAAIENAVNNGILSGYEDNTVRPDDNIKRSEMAAIITRACKVEEEGDISKFTDVNTGDWFYSAIAKAYAMDALAGDGNNMNPNVNITFQECFTVLSRVFDLLPPYVVSSAMPDPLPENTFFSGKRLYDISALAEFSDASDIADWAKVYVCGVVANGGWSGISGKLTPTAYITRGQFAIVMNNIIKNYIDEPDTYTELPEGSTMIRCDGVVLDGVTTDYDLYIGDSVSANGITINSLTANKRLVIRGCATPATDESGNKTFGNVGIAVAGHVQALRLIRPYINLDMLNSTYGTLYTVADTNISVTAQLNQ